jgi:hypothetical protein
MSTSSPNDLAVAFRSLARRLREAPTDETPPEAITSAQRSVNEAIAAAGAVMGTAPDAEAVAAAVQARHTRDWTDADLASLQSSAEAAARAIRTLQNS